MKPGDIYNCELVSLWKNSGKSQEAGIRLGFLNYGDIVIIIEVSHFEAKVITTNGIVGWIEKKYLFK